MAHIIVRVNVEYEESEEPHYIYSDAIEFPEGMVKHIQFGPLVSQAIEHLLQMVYPSKRGRDE